MFLLRWYFFGFYVFFFPFIFVIASSKELGNVLIITNSGVCFIITAVVYCRIYFIVKNHSNQIQVQVQVAQNSQMESTARKRKSAVSTFYVYLVFLVCCLPEYCVTVALLIFPPGTALTGLFLYSTTLVFLNSSLNPVIYGWKMRHIRLAMIDVLRNLFPKQNTSNS